MACGQVIDDAGHIADGQVVVGLPIVGRKVVGILGVKACCLQVAALALSSECDQVKEFNSVSPATKRCS